MSYQEQYQCWLSSAALSDKEKAELAAMANDPKEIEDRFFSQLEFGTAGLRGVMGLGLRRMNVHVIRHATQAFAQVILAEGPDAARGVAICYDCRINSADFAREAACVMAANGIPVRLFSAMRPTPELSFAVREYGCIAGLNVTASHNPPEYNGYKVYWSDGAQLPPHHAAAIAKVMEEIDVFDGVKTMDYQTALDRGLILPIGEETDEKFLSHVLGQINDKASVAKVADTFRMVYTPFHGTGYQQIPYILGELGIKHLYCVPEQMVIDGSFPTVKSPNPETPESFELAVKLARQVDADLILGSDPDADRVAIQVKNKDGEYVQISGNQTGVL
ncbi:MAG: phospho-sugar mutase, partial [Ruminiclostridium sp.]|nr:phospho-sugar mutase [Ruminiclostridium sp.]